MTQKETYLRGPIPKGMPTSCAPLSSHYTEMRGECQDLNQFHPHLNQTLTACEAVSDSQGTGDAGSTILTTEQPENKGQMPQNSSRFAQNIDMRPYAPLDPCALAVLEQIAEEVRA